jgi:hypothetical protein
MTSTDPTLADDAIPRCCRNAYRLDILEGRDPTQLRPLDPSGRYTECASCVPASRNVPDQGPARPYVPTDWTTTPATPETLETP